jgi:AraC-like DNA-binding protein
MLLRLHRPRPPLDRFVELVTYYEGFFPDHRRERLLPDGAVEIIIDLTDTPKRLYDREDFSRATAFRHAWISGMRRQWIVIEAAPGSSMAVIRFRPGGAFPVLGFDVAAITDVVSPLDDVVRRATATLRDRLLEAPDIEGKLAAVDAWLAARLRGRCETNPVVDYLASRLFAPAGIRIRDVVDELGYSQRHVLNLFRSRVGLTPKQYSRIRRFQQLLRATVDRSGAAEDPATFPLASPTLAEPDWGELALTHGYYDQAHMIHDFREFSGLTPGAYLTAYRGLDNYLPMD